MNQPFKILFEGDSVTDADRDRSDLHSLSGYSAKAAAALGQDYECFNRGISGARSCDLLARIAGEMDQIRPDFVSILIGVNDVMRKFDANKPTTDEEFRANLTAILDAVRPHVEGIMLIEPFFAPLSGKEYMRAELDGKIVIVRELAAAYGAKLLPLDGLFAEGCVADGVAKLTGDGVHPTPDGHALIAQGWLARFQAPSARTRN